MIAQVMKEHENFNSIQTILLQSFQKSVFQIVRWVFMATCENIIHAFIQ